MCCKGKFVKIFTALLFGLVALNFCFQNTRDARPSHPLHRDYFLDNPGYAPAPEFSTGHLVASTVAPDSEPLAYLFQILFILFIISPPLIVLMLFLILRELRARNRMK